MPDAIIERLDRGGVTSAAIDAALAAVDDAEQCDAVDSELDELLDSLAVNR